MLAFGCARSLTVSVRHAVTGEPLGGLLVERYRPASLPERIINPVGVAYHPLVCAETEFTNDDGDVAFHGSSSRDVYRVHTGAAIPMDIYVWQQHTLIAQPPGRGPDDRWVYSFWLQDGRIRHLVEPQSPK